MPWLMLDRIYVRGLQVHDVRVPKGLEWSQRSDHMPLIVGSILFYMILRPLAFGVSSASNAIDITLPTSASVAASKAPEARASASTSHQVQR